MIKINKHHINHYKKHGWVNVSMNLEDKFLDNCILALQRMRQKAIHENYPPRRIYYDHLVNFNLAAIELPFHQSICDPFIKKAFSLIKLGHAVNNLMGWKHSHCSLARIFTMSNLKYRGNWHRDDDGWNGDVYPQSMVQVGLFFERQDGFRIFKRKYDFNGIKSIIKNNKTAPDENVKRVPLKISHKYLNIIGGEKGSVLFFCPGLLHQGSSIKRRLDFHMRFYENSKNNKKLLSKNKFQDFMVANHLNESISIEDQIKQKIIPSQPRSMLIKRLINSVNYFLPVLSVIELTKDSIFIKRLKANPWQKDYFANTIFQKEK